MAKHLFIVIAIDIDLLSRCCRDNDFHRAARWRNVCCGIYTTSNILRNFHFGKNNTKKLSFIFVKPNNH